MSARCHFCGAALRPNTRFCLECGQQVQIVRPGSAGGTRMADPNRAHSTGGTDGSTAGRTASGSGTSPRVMPPPSLGYVPRSAGSAEPAVRITAPAPAPVAPAPRGTGNVAEAPQPTETAPDGTAAPVAPAADGSAVAAGDTSVPRAPRTPRPAPVRWVLSDDDGIAFPVTGDTVLGRRPGAYAQAEGLGAITVDDPLRSVSRVHLRLVPEETATLRITDAGSANGTRFERDDATTELTAGVPVLLRDGDVLWVGERRFRVRAEQGGTPQR